MINAMLTVEAIRTAMGKYGNRVLNGEEVRWGFENLDLTEARIRELGFEGLVRPFKISCLDHGGAHSARIHQWDGEKWVFTSDWIESDKDYLRPKMEEAAARYAQEKGITPAECS